MRMKQAPRTLTAPIRRVRFAWVALVFLLLGSCDWVASDLLQGVKRDEWVHRAGECSRREDV